MIPDGIVVGSVHDTLGFVSDDGRIPREPEPAVYEMCFSLRSFSECDHNFEEGETPRGIEVDFCHKCRCAMI